MNRFIPSLAYFLIVLGQLCLNCELDFNLSVDFSLELSAVLTCVGVAIWLSESKTRVVWSIEPSFFGRTAFFRCAQRSACVYVVKVH